MRYRLLITAIITCLALPAAADFRTIARAYEIALDNFTAPTSLNAATMFLQCNTCDTQSVRVTSVTEYRVNDKLVSLKEFRKLIFNVPNRSEKTVIVVHHLASDTVEQIQVDL